MATQSPSDSLDVDDYVLVSSLLLFSLFFIVPWSRKCDLKKPTVFLGPDTEFSKEKNKNYTCLFNVWIGDGIEEKR